MEIHITFPGGQRVDATFGEHVVHTDQPREQGGDNSAPSPFDLFLASLASCAGTYVLGFCQARSIPIEGIDIVQRNTTGGAIEIEVRVPASFPEKYLTAIARAAESCKVKKTIAAAPTVSVKVVQLPEDSIEICA